MRRVIYAAATAFAAFALMTACDKAESGNDNNSNGDGSNDAIESIADIPGDYSGSLTVTVATGEPTPVENQAIAIAANQEVENSIDLTVNNFSFMGIQLGNITIPNVPVSATDGTYSLSLSEPANVTLSSEAQTMLSSATATVTGTVESTGAITLSLNITATMAAPASSEIPVTVTFTGSKAAAE